MQLPPPRSKPAQHTDRRHTLWIALISAVLLSGPMIGIAAGQDAGGAWVQTAQLTDPAMPADANLGAAVAIDGDTAAIGAPGSDTVHLYTHDGTTWTATTTLTNPGPHTAFGQSLAIDDTTLAIGASGATYVYELEDESWNQEAHLMSTSAAPGSAFGRTVALAQDTLLVSAHRDHTNEANRAGAVYAYERTTTGWTEAQKLTADDPTRNARFGWDITLDPDTDTAAISATGTPAVHVYDRTAGTWTHTAELMPPEGDPSFGYSVALDGQNLAIGAPFDRPWLLPTGAVYLYHLDVGTWEHTTTLFPADAWPLEQPGATNFGFDIDYVGDTLLAGAPGDDLSPGIAQAPAPTQDPACFELSGLLPTCSDPGAAYVFHRTTDGWHQAAKLTPTDGLPATARETDNRDWFGFSVALHPSQTHALLGAPRDDRLPTQAEDTGAVYAFNHVAWGLIP